MKIWVPKQRKVTVTYATEANEDLGIKVGDMQVTDADGRTRLYSPQEFEERFEQVEENSWPGYLKRKAGESFMNGTLVVGFEGASLAELVANMNAWAEKSENRHLILGDHGDKHFQGPDGRFYAIYYCYAHESKESIDHLNETAAIEEEVRAEVKARHEARKKQLGIDERNVLEKAKDAKVAQEAIDRQRMRELLEKERIAKHCEANHGKAMKGKRS